MPKPTAIPRIPPLAPPYRLISQFLTAARIELEPWAARFPTTDVPSQH